jgi:hypothetical protein
MDAKRYSYKMEENGNVTHKEPNEIQDMKYKK